MYSYELEQYVRIRNYLLDSKETLEVIDPNKNTQIIRVHYDPFDDHYEVNTNDDYHLYFKVKKLGSS